MRLIIVSWKQGLKKVSLCLLLRTKCVMGLKKAKDTVDSILEGNQVQVAEMADDKIYILKSEIEELGAICRID